MDYKVTKVVAKQVNKPGSRNDRNWYVVCTVENEENDDVREVAVFGREAEKYLACLSTANHGTAGDTDKPIPEKNAVWKNVTDEIFVFPEPMVRVNENNQPETNKRGQMYIRTSCRVTTRYNFDQMRAQMLDINGKPMSPYVPKPGWDVTTRGTSIMNAFYMPLRMFNGAQGGTNPIEDAANNNGAGDDLPV